MNHQENLQLEVVEATLPAKRSLWERGLTTVEYAIGLLAAATVALVLIRIFADNSFFKFLYDFVIGIFRKIIP